MRKRQKASWWSKPVGVMWRRKVKSALSTKISKATAIETHVQCAGMKLAAEDSNIVRAITVGEEIANSISHGLGLMLAIVALPVLVLSAVRGGRPGFIVGASVFGATMIALYLASTLYHSLTHAGAKRVFRVFDHS